MMAVLILLLTALLAVAVFVVRAPRLKRFNSWVARYPLSTAIITLAVCLAIGLGSIEYTVVRQHAQAAAQAHQRALDQIDTQYDSCGRGNELRLHLRELAVRLGADPATQSIVDDEFADVDCTALRDEALAQLADSEAG